MFVIDVLSSDTAITLSRLMMTAGLWQILKKCGQPGWWALVPGGRWYKLGQCAGREREGRSATAMEIISVILSAVSRLLGADTRPGILVGLAALVVTLFQLVYQIRIYGGMCQTFQKRRLWIFLWVLLEGVAAVIWGFGKSFQPVNLGKVSDDDHLAGTAPVNTGVAGEARMTSGFVLNGDGIPEAAPSLPAGEGLDIRLKARTVRDFTQKRYLLKDIALAIPNGSMVLLLGGSGAGKTTFVNAITGYEKADAAMVLNGSDIYKNYNKMKYRIGFVPQQPLIRMNDTVNRTLQDAAALRMPAGADWKARMSRVESVKDTLGLSSGSHGLVAKKSGGRQKRISIGMELIADPDLFILDEPDSGLDGVIARELFEKLREVADEGKIVIVITHTPDRVIDLFDYVIVLARDSGRTGRLAFFGSPDAARVFFGKPSMEEIVMSVNSKSEGGEGRSDEFITAFAAAVQSGELRTPEAAPDEAREEAAGAESPDSASTGTLEEDTGDAVTESQELKTPPPAEAEAESGGQRGETADSAQVDEAGKEARP